MTGHLSDDDLRDLLDGSFGDGPPAPSAADRLVPARRALRRRRLTSGTSLVGTVAAVALAAALLGGPGGGSTAVEPAVGPSGTPSSTPDVEPTPSSEYGLESEALPSCDDTPRAAVCVDEATCRAFLSGITDLDRTKGVEFGVDLNALELEYDAASDRLVLPRGSDTTAIAPDGDQPTPTCEIDGSTIIDLPAATPSADAEGQR